MEDRVYGHSRGKIELESKWTRCRSNDLEGTKHLLVELD